MLIQSLIQRAGDPAFTLSVANRRYHFEPNERGDVVAEVCVKEHADHLLRDRDFCRYEPGPDTPDAGTD